MKEIFHIAPYWHCPDGPLPLCAEIERGRTDKEDTMLRCWFWPIEDEL